MPRVLLRFGEREVSVPMAQPTEDGVPGTATAGRRAGIAFAVLAAASASLLLALPVMLLGYTLHVLSAVIRGDGLAWQSSVAMTYTFVGIPALASLVLLVVPYRLFRAAGRRLGTRRAVLWVAGLLAVWHIGVAAAWAWNATSGFSHARVGSDPWHPIGFGIVAVVAAVVVGKRAAVIAIALVAVLAIVLSGVVRGHTPIPAGAQEVHVAVNASGVAQVDPQTVHAGDIYVVLDTPRSSISFVQDELTGTDLPRTGSFDLDGCSDTQRAEDLGQQGYCGNAFKVTMQAGKYVFIGPNGEGPPSPLARLEVLP
jgi:hypothetical protein